MRVGGDVVEKRALQKSGESAAGIAVESDRGSAVVVEGEDVADASFTSEELREFLEADTAGDLADPEFKERLRQKLWEMLQRRAGRRLPDEN
jgi:hypothetical protein